MGNIFDLYAQSRGPKKDLSLIDKLMMTWPVQMAKSAYQAAQLPGDVYAGRVDPLSDQGVQRAADLAGMVTLGSGAMPAAGNDMRMGIKAYHGSPHDFDKFDMSRIGTGEGAQAYGHGLYFAEKEEVAKKYRDNLSTYKLIQDYNNANPANRPGQVAQWWTSGMDLPKIDEALKVLEPQSTQAMRDEWIRQGQKLHDDFSSQGRMYEVSINADPDEFLDWDKPLSEQSEKVQAAVKDYLTAARGTVKDSLTVAPSGASAIEASGAEPASQISANLTGGQLYEQGYATRTKPRRQTAVDISEALRAAGIPGTKYLDAGSRAAGDGSRNYVVFDDNLIEILRKYGLAGLTAGLGGTVAAAQPWRMTPQQADAYQAGRVY